eukprot:2826228-Amphidinium_carterae.1
MVSNVFLKVTARPHSLKLLVRQTTVCAHSDCTGLMLAIVSVALKVSHTHIDTHMPHMIPAGIAEAFKVDHHHNHPPPTNE